MAGHTKHLKALKRERRKGKRTKAFLARAWRRRVVDVDAARLREFAARLGLA